MALEGDTLATARVRVIADARGMPDDVRKQSQKGLADAGERAGTDFGKRMSLAIGAAIAVGAAVVGRKLVAGLKESIAAASDLNEISNKVSVVFGRGAKDVEKFASTAATSLGQTRAQALDAAATFAVFGKGANLTGKSLVGFSTKLVSTATDMASFSNTTPTEAIDAIGSALRGEFDPIERYGVLLNETSVKAEAMSLGLLKGSKNVAAIRAAQLTATVAQHRYSDAVKEHGARSDQARTAHAGLIRATESLKKATAGTTGTLTSQQRVLAVQSLIMKQTSDAQGDFGRTSTGLANQQRILTAQFGDLKASIGQALLPVVLKLTTALTTSLMPTLKQLWTTYGPAVTRFLTDAADKFGVFLAHLDVAQVREWGVQLGKSFSKLKQEAGPALQQLSENIGPIGDSIRTKLLPALHDLQDNGGTKLSDALKVSGVFVQFLADHLDLLAKAMPYVVAALVAFKVAQLGSNIALAASPILRIIEVSATKKQTAAIIANTAARTGETVATEVGSGAKIANTAAENGGILARGRAIVVMVAQRVATIASTAATWLMTAATTAMGVALRIATGPIGIVITAIAALAAIVIYAYKHNETFRKIVDAVWKAIKIAIKAVADWWTQTAWPGIKRGIDALIKAFQNYISLVRAIWASFKSFIGAGVDSVVAKFTQLRNFVLVTIPNAFKTGVAAIGKFWAGLQELARRPIVFVVGIVNKLIAGYNKIAGVFHAPKADPITGFAAGGRIPGDPSDVDNMLAEGPRKRLLKVATGEFIVNARQTSKNLPLLQAVNAGTEGFALGGLVGGVLDFFKNPVAFVKNLAGGFGDIVKNFGDSGLAQMLVGMGKELVKAVGNTAKGLFSSGGGGSGAFGAWPSSPAAQRGDSGVWRAIVALIRSTGPLSGTFGNAYRPGDPLWHGSGRAVDWMGFNQDALATFLASRRPLELIHRTSQRDYAYTRGRNMGSFNSALMQAHRNHIHIAMAQGGLMEYNHGAFLRRYDTGGPWPSGTAGVNTSGRTEYVATGSDMDQVVELLTALLAAVRNNASELGTVLMGTGPAIRVAARQSGRSPR